MVRKPSPVLEDSGIAHNFQASAEITDSELKDDPVHALKSYISSTIKPYHRQPTSFLTIRYGSGWWSAGGPPGAGFAMCFFL